MQLESALLRLSKHLVNPTAAAQAAQGETQDGQAHPMEAVSEMQATIRSGMNLVQFRELTVSQQCVQQFERFS